MATVNESEIVIEITDSLCQSHKLNLTKAEAISLYNELHKLFGEKTLQYPQGVRGSDLKYYRDGKPYDIIATPEGLKINDTGNE